MRRGSHASASLRHRSGAVSGLRTQALPALPHAIAAARDGGVGCEAGGRDLIAAIGAIAVVALLQPFEGGVDALTLGGAAADLGLGHGLILDGVHAGEPARRLLVQRHGPGGVMGGGILGIEGVETRLEDFAGVHGVTLGGVCGGVNKCRWWGGAMM